VFFDAMDIKWAYEVEGYQLQATGGRKEYYLPDFQLIDWPEGGCWAEVKGAPELFKGESLRKIKLLAEATKKPVVCLPGQPDFRAYEVVGFTEPQAVLTRTFLAVLTKKQMVGEMRNCIRNLYNDKQYVRAIEKSRAERFGT
jgi:hypothetical protein